jgi:cell filamentation protein
MMVQAGHPPMDYSSWDNDREGYFSAINQGLDRNYNPMKALIKRGMGND